MNTYPSELPYAQTANADTPVEHGQTAILTCDVWEADEVSSN